MLLAFLLLPLTRLMWEAATPALWWDTLTTARHLRTLLVTLALAACTTAATLLLALPVALLIGRRRFAGRRWLLALLTLPLAFPGVVVGFMVILLAGRQGLIGRATGALGAEPMVFAYSLAGLFIGYLYFSLPRAIATLAAAAETLDPAQEDAARTLGAGPLRRLLTIVMPQLVPALLAVGAICFATAMGALGTAFTLATGTTVLPMAIYAEFTVAANIGTAAVLSALLGVTTWLVLVLARGIARAPIAAAA